MLQRLEEKEQEPTKVQVKDRTRRTVLRLLQGKCCRLSVLAELLSADHSSSFVLMFE